jgi:hypothetical protein
MLPEDEELKTVSQILVTVRYPITADIYSHYQKRTVLDRLEKYMGVGFPTPYLIH